MALSPERWPATIRHGVKKGLLLGAAGTAGVALLWVFSDRLIAGLYEQFRPRLERQIGTAMGHPLQLGPYEGFSLDGLHLGRTRFLKGQQDDSTMGARALRVGIQPLTSWRRRSLVVDLTILGGPATQCQGADLGARTRQG
jgi:translocation and assembly module TamB